MKKYLVIVIIAYLFCSCDVCKKTVGRHKLEIQKENLVCSCNSLKEDTILGEKIGTIEKSSARYLVGAVITSKDKKGIYQYVKTGSGIRGNMFMYYNGKDVYILNKDNVTLFSDSLINLGINKNKVDKIIPLVKESLSKPAENTTDSF